MLEDEIKGNIDDYCGDYIGDTIVGDEEGQMNFYHASPELPLSIKTREKFARAEKYNQ